MLGLCGPLVDLTDDFLSLTARWSRDVTTADEDCDSEKQDYSTAASSSTSLGQDDAPKAPNCNNSQLDAALDRMKKLPVGTDACVFDINLHEGMDVRQNIQEYLALCKMSVGLHVTTSCFALWRKQGKTNGSGKVIPVSCGEPEAPRVFFFDDNLEWDGQHSSSGICNLRDTTTGEFVSFAEGENGFCVDHVARHTVIHHSDIYKAVLVKANILDAMEDPEYFTSIVERYVSPGEQIIIYMDVNSTIVCNDTIQGKDLGGTLLSTMFEFIELRPNAPFVLSFDGHDPIRIEKSKKLKTIVKEVTAKSHEAYGAFWTEDKCWRLFSEVAQHGQVTWSGRPGAFSLDDCQSLFQEYLVSLGRIVNKDGIAPSWFQVFSKLKGEHAIFLNSFGVDTRKVILATVPDEQNVMQVTVNYDLWEARDVQKFEGQFEN
mmetsp:Transcript_17793/g.38108  ORF Transcript_17793/g.38108 Transcript_17793/m.38108 type:complete len:431 (-) Transcript_17793:154-1446(-)